MEIQAVTGGDMPAWRALSAEYDQYITGLGASLGEWYDGDGDSPAFDAYMSAKIRQQEAYMAVDHNSCLGVIAYSKRHNRITFFGVAHRADFWKAGYALIHHAISALDAGAPIQINEIACEALWIKQHGVLYESFGFTLRGRATENGVPVNSYERPPAP